MDRLFKFHFLDVEWICPEFGVDNSHIAIQKAKIEEVEITGDFYFGEHDETP
jgi:hypothetical protein